jgi:hypothetical protein
MSPPTSFGAKLGIIPITTVTITNDDSFKKMVEKFANIMQAN